MLKKTISAYKLRIGKKRYLSAINAIQQGSGELKQQLAHLQECFQNKFSERMGYMPVQISVSHARSNVLEKELNDLEQQQKEFLYHFERASDPIADRMEDFVARLRDLSEGLKSLLNRSLQKLESWKKKKKTTSSNIINLRLQYKIIQNENIELAIQINKHQKNKKGISINRVNSAESLFFISEPSITKIQSGPILQVQDTSPFINLQQHERRGLGYRLEFQKISWRKQVIEKTVELQSNKVAKKMRRMENLRLLLRVMEDKARQYENMENDLDMKLSQLSDKRILYRFMFQSQNFKIIRNHIRQMIQDRESFLPRLQINR